LLSAYQKQSSSYISFMLTASLPPFPYQYLLFSINLFRSLKKKTIPESVTKKGSKKKKCDKGVERNLLKWGRSLQRKRGGSCGSAARIRAQCELLVQIIVELLSKTIKQFYYIHVDSLSISPLHLSISLVHLKGRMPEIVWCKQWGGLNYQ